jgi:hypothetical protein
MSLRSIGPAQESVLLLRGVGPVAWVRIENQTVNQGFGQSAKAGDAPVEPGWDTGEVVLKLVLRIPCKKTAGLLRRSLLVFPAHSIRRICYFVKYLYYLIYYFYEAKIYFP